jgi:hypothetical protein
MIYTLDRYRFYTDRNCFHLIPWILREYKYRNFSPGGVQKFKSMWLISIKNEIWRRERQFGSIEDKKRKGEPEREFGRYEGKCKENLITKPNKKRK